MSKSCLAYLDLPHLILAIVLFALVGVSMLQPPHPMAIPENDSQSNYPGNGKDTIKVFVLVGILAASGIVVLVLMKILSRFFSKVFKPFHFWSALWNFAIALASCTLAVNVIKNVVGRPRPDIYNVCGKSVGKDISTCSKNITKSQFYDEYRSWPSGHSSSAMAGYAFIALFLKREIYGSTSIAFFIAFCVLVIPLYIGATRIVDYRHHADDVLAGFFVGFLISYFVFSTAKNDMFEVELSEVSADNSDPTLSNDDAVKYCP